MRAKAVTFALLATLALACGCTSIDSRHRGPFILHGMAYDDNGQPVPDIRLSLDDQRYARSDFNGRFFFSDIVPGDYTLTAEGGNHETLKRTIRVSHPTEVLYLSLVSMDGLYRSFVAAMEAKDWKEADAYIERALAVGPGEPLLRYAKALALSVANRPDRNWMAAEGLLQGLLEDGYQEPAIYLLLADIYEYDRLDPAEALLQLERYLRLEHDPGIAERARRIRGTL